ncbi:copper amine oxidase N-terminal domain-containing protein [Clostridium sp. 'deep sea']|uniref:copper amine oxidase N-terminal domain-containing protein n=1 Tax=Clostridium sp. 'deep sea' TaxID=2779445 RepID=UPI001896558F|nr:copper amine oxidase N-terminal domain-containing protein [Clostridium sp. 'deep sea']QOR34240.1 copper amine oxidase N-terminal domain-containing protein [Clostridium sp. 'deep sea']
MKRLISLFTLIMLIFGLFSNTALADSIEPHQVAITLNRTSIPYSSGTKVEEISGRIFSESTKALYEVNSLIKILKDDGNGVVDSGDIQVAQVRASNGEFSHKIYTDTVETGVAQYWVIGVDSACDTDYSHSKPFTFLGKATIFYIMYEIELAEPNSLNYTYPVSGELVIRGTFKNNDAGATPEIHLAYTDKFKFDDRDNTSIATADFSSSESFGFLFNGQKFVKTGDIAIYVNGIKAVKGLIEPDELIITTTPNKFKKCIPQFFLVDLNIPAAYLDSVNQSLGADYQLKAIITKPNGDTDSTILMDYNDTFTNFVGLQHEIFMSFQELGTNKVTYQLCFDQKHILPPGSTPPVLKDSFIVKEKTIEYQVSRPNRYNLVYWNINKHKIGEIKFALSNSAYHIDRNNVYVIEYLNDSTMNHMEYIEIILNGCGVDTKFKTFDENGLKPMNDDYDGLFATNTSETGELEIIINVYKDETATKPLFTEKKSINIYGWNVKIEPNTLTVNSTEDVVFTITDENNQPINNALVIIGDEKIVDCTTSNIENGRYIYSGDLKDIFKLVQTLPVSLYTLSEYAKGNTAVYEVLKSNAIDVIGKEVYTVKSNKVTLLNGVTETIKVRTTAENGDTVYPSFYRIDIDAKGNKSTPVKIPATCLGEFTDTEDGQKERPIKVHTNGSQTAVIIRATTDNKELMGEVKIDVQKPKVEITGLNTITQNFNQPITLKLLDPRDNSILEYDYELQKVDSYYDINKDNEWHYNDKNKTYTKKVLITNVNYTQATKDEKDVVLNLVMQGDNSTDVILHSFPIADAKIIANPDKLVINIPTYLTLKYKDADNKPITKQAVYLEDFYVGETDDKGEVLYAASATSSRALNFRATTEIDNVYTPLKIRATPDINSPQATIELLSTNSALITITDNVRLLMSYVDGELVNMPFPKHIATHKVTNLVAGENSFVIQAMDINNNILDTQILITVNKPKPLVIKKAEPTGYGLIEFVNDTTMVPVRLAEKLGATVNWSSKNHTVVYTLNDKNISITIGKKYALVNGKQIELPEVAYINKQQHVMVPLRLIANELGYSVEWISNNQPIIIK